MHRIIIQIINENFPFVQQFSSKALPLKLFYSPALRVSISQTDSVDLLVFVLFFFNGKVQRCF